LILHELIASTPWRQENVVVWSKTFPQPRLVAWYGDRGSDYTWPAPQFPTIHK
jgi:hypothetical protein